MKVSIISAGFMNHGRSKLESIYSFERSSSSRLSCHASIDEHGYRSTVIQYRPILVTRRAQALPGGVSGPLNIPCERLLVALSLSFNHTSRKGYHEEERIGDSKLGSKSFLLRLLLL
eukprot:2539582-Amphidinium_carterae.1